ncbi:radical SAM protein [Chloroflexota bacterium]
MTLEVRKGFPRLPLDGRLDITYRCNNTCMHCWLWQPNDARQVQEELTTEEIQHIVDESRRMGCQAWSISGGEPMLRPDFLEIFDYVTRKSVHYSLNTNGTLITSQIACSMKRPGNKMVALYGATAEVHDRVTRNPGSFEATMRGFAYLKEAGAGFTVQIIPMAANYHQYSRMLELARSLSPDYRVGSPWLFLSACRSDARNREIARQRLKPADVIVLDEPDSPFNVLDLDVYDGTVRETLPYQAAEKDDRIFAACIAARRDFHIDPYGKMTFCCFIKDPALRYNLRQGSFREAWDDFIPSLADKVRGGQEYLENCGSCSLRQDCHWCGVYGYLEHGRFSAKVDYLCQVAEEAHRFKEEWRSTHVRYFQIAGITIQIAADFPIKDETFATKFEKFQVDGPGDDTIALRLISSIPPRSELRLGQEVYHKAPWAIYRNSQSWTYLGILPNDDNDNLHSLAIFEADHSRGSIYRQEDVYIKGNLESLTTFPSDQILLARLLADRQGLYLHSSGIMINGKGLLFVGHSEAGKSTMMKMLRQYGEILCDDRNILRRWPEGFRIHGTWSHGELPDVSPAGAPLQAIMFLEKANCNELLPTNGRIERLGLILSHVVKPLITADWWEKTIDLAGKIAEEVPIYYLRFDKSGKVWDLLQDFIS